MAEVLLAVLPFVQKDMINLNKFKYKGKKEGTAIVS